MLRSACSRVSLQDGCPAGNCDSRRGEMNRAALLPTNKGSRFAKSFRNTAPIPGGLFSQHHRFGFDEWVCDETLCPEVCSARPNQNASMPCNLHAASDKKCHYSLVDLYPIDLHEMLVTVRMRL